MIFLHDYNSPKWLPSERDDMLQAVWGLLRDGLDVELRPVGWRPPWPQAVQTQTLEV